MNMLEDINERRITLLLSADNWDSEDNASANSIVVVSDECKSMIALEDAPTTMALHYTKKIEKGKVFLIFNVKWQLKWLRNSEIGTY